MEIAHGETRWVILTERYAIKIARIRPLRPVLRIYRHFRGKKVNPSLLTYDGQMAKGCLRFIIPGIAANRAEIRLYRRFKNAQLAPTLFTFFWLINIQERGKPVGKSEIRLHPLWQLLCGDPLFHDTLRSCQFCDIKGKVHLADYGRSDLEKFLPVL